MVLKSVGICTSGRPLASHVDGAGMPDVLCSTSVAVQETNRQGALPRQTGARPHGIP